MNNIIFQSIRAVMIVGVAFFAFADSVFAAPSFLPTSVVDITDTSAVIRGYLQNPGKISVVWFEWSESSSASSPTVVGMKNFVGDGFQEMRLTGLTPGATYSYRIAAREGSDTAYTPVSSFRTNGFGSSSSQATAPLGLGSLTTPSTQAPVVSQTQPQSYTQTTTQVVEKTTPVVKKKTVAVENIDGFTNNSSASVIGGGSGVLPTTLIGWVLLLLAILVAVLILDVIYRSFERRKKEREEREKAAAKAKLE